MDRNLLYPLQFNAQLHYRLWGGERLKTLLGKASAPSSCGESWEISALEGKNSVVSNGPLRGKKLSELISAHPEAVLGEKSLARFGENFPLLIKFIDAKEPLSVQVHPNNALAQERHNSWGKSEMWYIIDASPEAVLTLGFNQSINSSDFQQRCKDRDLASILQEQKVRKGDVVDVPAGLLHAIGGGILLAEIQQASDITYRVYDYERIDTKKGKARRLHQEKALAAIDFSLKGSLLDYKTEENKAVDLVHNDHFSTKIIHLNGQYSTASDKNDSFEILIGVEGAAQLDYEGVEYEIGLGNCLLLPAALNSYQLKGEGKVLSVKV